MATIEGIKGGQYLLGTRDYEKIQYSYSESTYGVERNLTPGLIVTPKTKEDIALALKYAKEKGIAVAVKTGGHQYSGASSTTPENMQLDLRESFRSKDDRVVFRKDDKAYVRSSVSWALGEFNEWMGDNNVFVPTGQCEQVHVGGHVQTGGYGQLARSFGLFGDHVLSLEIVDADGNFREVTKTSDPDLFFAFMGGSPGNLGVITHFTIQVHRDEDYAGSRGMKAIYWYDRDTLERLLSIMADMAEKGDLPRNYDYCVSVLSESFPLLRLFKDHKQLDHRMKLDHPRLYGPDDLPFWPKIIIVYAQWVPFSPEDKPDMAWFDRIKEGSIDIFGLQKLAGINVVHEKPMSQLTADWIFRDVREYEKPYVKRTYTTNSRTLSQDGWPKWAADRMDAIVADERNRCWLSAQLQYFGGQHSTMAKNAGNGTAFSWRDTTVGCTMDCFHDDETKDRAEDWQKVNDQEAIGPQGIFSKEDRRWLWGSYGDWDLDKVWDCYYEDREKYDLLREVRKGADPYGTFTPNPFCVKKAD